MLKHKASIASPQVLKPLILLLLALLVAGAAAGVTLSLTQAQSANGVYDTDGDKLIEITYLEQLAAIAYDLDGDGEADNTASDTFYSLAFPVEADESVCDSDCKGYELTKSLDFEQTGSYSSGVINPFWTDPTISNGWIPIFRWGPNRAIKGYAATFEGNGHSIANLYSNEPIINNDTGLFAALESGATVKNIGLTGVDVTGGNSNTGALVGNNKGTITLSHASGKISGKGDTGGLVGNNNGTVSKSHSAVAVSGGEKTDPGHKPYTGGLVGDNTGTISHSYATGAVAGKEKVVGGLAGYNIGTVTHSYASGPVSGKDSDVGGLVGKNASKVTASYANAAVSGSKDYVGGLVGNNLGTVTVSYASGAVSGTGTGAGNNVGGLAGANSGTVRSAYAVGDVSGNASVGGLIGQNTATVELSFAASDSVTGQSSIGGLIGSISGGNVFVTDSYWDTDIGPSSSASGDGRPTSALQTPTGYTGIYQTWDDGDEGSVWDFGTASQYPALKADLNDDGTATVGEFGSQRSSSVQTPTATPTPATPTPAATTGIQSASATSLSPSLSAEGNSATTLKLTISNHSSLWQYKQSTGASNTCQTGGNSKNSSVVVTGLAINTSYTYAAYDDPECQVLLATAPATSTLKPSLASSEVTADSAKLTISGWKPGTDGSWYYKANLSALRQLLRRDDQLDGRPERPDE